jgi:hypothetical protein
MNMGMHKCAHTSIYTHISQSKVFKDVFFLYYYLYLYTYIYMYVFLMRIDSNNKAIR